MTCKTYCHSLFYMAILIETTIHYVHGRPMYIGIETYSEFYNLPPLPFKFGSMEPQYDASTMKIHYVEVHANFTKNMNRLLKDWRAEVKELLTSLYFLGLRCLLFKRYTFSILREIIFC